MEIREKGRIVTRVSSFRVDMADRVVYEADNEADGGRRSNKSNSKGRLTPKRTACGRDII